ncbi:hypothetical protein G9A89_021469 [Geosiphon pyriformis]|nr:hypothetical protein G9A89_021469 [Geosiphon pyriformis]
MATTFSLDGLEDRIKAHSDFVDGVISLIPPKHYFKNEPSGEFLQENTTPFQPNKRKRISKEVHKEQKRRGKKLKLDPVNLKTVQEIQLERLEKMKRIALDDQDLNNEHKNKSNVEEQVQNEDDMSVPPKKTTPTRSIADRLAQLRRAAINTIGEKDGEKNIKRRVREAQKKEKKKASQNKKSKAIADPIKNGSKNSTETALEDGEADEDKILFSKFEFNDEKKKNKKKDDKQLIKKLELHKKEVGMLKQKDPEKAGKLVEAESWKKVLQKAYGEKIKDDPKRLKKTIKRVEKTKKASEKSWKTRLENIANKKEILIYMLNIMYTAQKENGKELSILRLEAPFGFKDMEMEATPVNTAHAYANAAEEFEEKEQWGKALEAHFRAAEQFLLAISYTSDSEAIRTLKMLYANHNRQGKELQRRLSKQSQSSPRQKAVQSSSGSNSQPLSSSHRNRLPPSSSSPGQTPRQNSSYAAHRLHQQQNLQIQKLQQTSRLSSAGHSSPIIPRDYFSTNQHSYDDDDDDGSGFNIPSLASRNNISQTKSNNERSQSPTPSLNAPRDSVESLNPSLNQSSVSVEESYMVLKENNDSADDDDSDPFNKFWEIVESLVSKVSNPVAFATVPLHLSGFRNINDYSKPLENNIVPLSLPIQNKLNQHIETYTKPDALSSTMVESYFIVPTDKKLISNNSAGEYSASLSGNKNPPSISKTIEEYAIENQQLKLILDNLSKRMLAYEKAAEENSMLKSSIMQFRNDVEKQAKRIKQSQELRSSLLVRQLSPDSSAVTNSNFLQRRVKELEDELRKVKHDNETQKVLMTKYRERWEKLKESAKKRRSEKQSDSVSGSPTNAALSLVTNNESKYRQTSTPSTTYSRPQLSPSPTSRTPTPKPPSQGSVSPPASPTIFGFPKQRQGVGGLFNSPSHNSNSKGNNVVLTARERTPVPPTTTIVHATATGSPTITHDRSQSMSSDLPFALSQPELKRPNSSSSLMPHISSAPRRDSAPEIYFRRHSSTSSISSINAIGTSSVQSVYHTAPLAASNI